MEGEEGIPGARREKLQISDKSKQMVSHPNLYLLTLACWGLG